jgi:signal transduction histidine kinase
MASESEAAALLSLGDFLTTDEPVWVWDASSCRILWANPAGRAFWGAASLDALRARKFSSRSKSIRRLNDLAAVTGASRRERLETLSLTGASGPKSVKCYVQSLEVAGGHPGLIVKALPVGPAGRDAPPGPPASAETAASPDRAALNAIARRLKTGARTGNRPPLAEEPPRPPASGQAAVVISDALNLKIRELCHELRNPLTVILGFAERIRDGVPAGKRPEQICGYADNILESAQLAMAILGEFSNRLLSPQEPRDDAGPAEIQPAIESCLRLIAPLAKQAGIKVSRRTSGPLPALPVSEHGLRQILLNLLMNAVRHQKTGGSVKVTALARKDGSVRLAVADDGRGMTKKEIKTVMKAPRDALPPARQRQPGSSGLGLPLVKRLAETAGGVLSIESARGKGTTVAIVFKPDLQSAL